MESYRLERLIALIEENHRILSSHSIDEPAWDTIKGTAYKEQVIECYKSLGGQFNEPFIKAENWQIVLENDFIIQLDDALHFNRYRMQTLRSEIYTNLPDFPIEPYRNFCRKNESECVKAGLAGNNWTSSFAEKQFGRAEERGDFAKNGSPAWKLRAYRDFLQDASALALNKKIFRISIFQQMMINRQLYKIGDILMGGSSDQLKSLQNYIDRKISS
ncbi:DUF7255 family protein [Chondrinema litorale]|uniref:DUF7255 family protein n=1 Tax=Chondrinema litorale TaxID=2994555 RepID=UPI0025432938|nr:hypothetical protein [Chondrinema litorale]UZR94965.1 hypothetical protein OQ292_03945 [Chondrinema litorale]